MADITVELIIFVALLVHGIGHAASLATLVIIAYRPAVSTGHWLAAKSWLLPSFSKRAATVTASGFWIASFVAFVVTALSFWGVLIPDVWRTLGILAAILSSVGIILFLRTWPTFNTVAAMGMNVVAVVLALAWPA